MKLFLTYQKKEDKRYAVNMIVKEVSPNEETKQYLG